MKNDNYYGSLFSGFEGFGIAAEKAGYKPRFHCEINEFSQQVLQHNYNNPIIHDDIRTTDFTIYRGTVKLLFGGFPCQPYSLAGKRKGTADPRNLWPQMLRAIREIQPPWVIGENVPGLINWSKGMVFEQVQSDLEAEGYEIIPFLLPAAGVGAPHKRERIWFVAYSSNARLKRMRQRGENTVYQSGNATNSNKQHGNISGHGAGEIPQLETARLQQYNTTHAQCPRPQKPETGEQPQPIQHAKRNHLQNEPATHAHSYGYKLRRHTKNRSAQSQSTQQQQKRQWLRHNIGRTGQPWHTANTECEGLQGSQQYRTPHEKQTRQQTSGPVAELHQSNYWRNFPTQPPVCGRDDGLRSRVERYLRNSGTGVLTQKEIDQIVSKTITKVRTESIKGYGNAIVWQVFYQIMLSINEFEKINNL